MTRLEYTLRSDTLFKMLFVRHPYLLKELVSELLGIRLGSIGDLVVTNPEMPPENLGDKFCRLDINMTVDGRRVDLEVQVSNEGDYPERSLYYWAREYSSALGEGHDYSELPKTVVISILYFNLFECEEHHSEFAPLEVKRHEPLTDRMALHYFELPKLPETLDATQGRDLWLSLFRAETEEELAKLESLEVPVMQEAVRAFRRMTTEPEFREMERLRSKARHDEAQALKRAAILATEAEREKWQAVVAEKDTIIAELRARLGEGE